MGIKGLLPYIEKACRQGHAEEFKGKRVAVDVSCLLHRGVFGCVESIANGIKTDFCIKYIEKHLSPLRFYDCKIIMVFDGKPLPAKETVNDERRKRREHVKKMGEELMAVGLESEAYKVFRQGIGVPRHIMDDTIRHYNGCDDVDVIVAPYEADAQLAFLVQQELVDIVITEDSDLVVFGCAKVLFKLKENGSCVVYEKQKLTRCLPPLLAKNFEFSTFRRMCIMSGCDYLPSGLCGIGLKKAESIFSQTTITDLNKLLPKVPYYSKNRSLRVTPAIVKSFIEADLVFQHQIVYDPRIQRNIPLTPYPGTSYDDYHEPGNDLLSTVETYKYAGVLGNPQEALLASKGGPECKPSQNPGPVYQSVTRTSTLKSQSGLVKPPSMPSSLKTPLPLKQTPNLLKRTSNWPGIFSSGVKRRVVCDENNPIVLNGTEPPRTLGNFKLNRKIINPSSEVGYTKISIKNVGVNRPFVSPLLRRPQPSGVVSDASPTAL